MKRLLLLATLVSSFYAADAAAFCGFYVGGAGADLYANATQVVLMREGTTTILSMQNRYEGPPEDFAMVVPVPVVLTQNNVKTLDEAVFRKIDQLTAPRLVEYQEEDPCQTYQYENNASDSFADAGSNETNNGVVVEAQFKVGEYDIAILSANDSTGLETYLTDNGYNIPDGAAPYFEPYIQSGMYFFVAKVDIALAPVVNGKTVLSPLRFNYTETNFSLPVRLGLINSSGTQDILIYTLARNQRYEVANRPNVTIPTNIEVVDDVRNSFADFYQALFARTLKENPNAVVTEYAWASHNCDPCPGPTLDPSDLLTLGADLLNGAENDFSWVVTRLHARYDKDEVGDDLVFRAASPIVGGREFVIDQTTGKLEEGAQPSDSNAFQGRYIIRMPWTGPTDCEDPQFGRWGERTEASPSPNSTGGEVVLDSSRNLVADIIGNVPEIGVEGTGSRTDGPGTPGTPDAGNPKTPNGVKGDLEGSGCSASGLGTIPFALGLVGFAARRRRRNS